MQNLRKFYWRNANADGINVDKQQVKEKDFIDQQKKTINCNIVNYVLSSPPPPPPPPKGTAVAMIVW